MVFPWDQNMVSYYDIQLELQLYLLEDLNMEILILHFTETIWGEKVDCILKLNREADIGISFNEEIFVHDNSLVQKDKMNRIVD